MDVFDLSSQEEFSPLKPLTKRARRVLTPTQDQSLTASTPTDENDNCRQSQTDSKNSGSSRTEHSEKQDSDGALMLAQCSDCNVSVSSSKEACDSDRQTEDAKRPIYVYSQELIRRCDAMPKIINRASMVHGLIEAYGLLQYMQVVPPRLATTEEMLGFHAKDYIDFLTLLSHQSDEEKFEDESEQYGLTYDCPVNRHVFAYAALTSGASLQAAECLLKGQGRVAVNWCGGWHHAKRDMASGFCYINDIVLAILKLRERYDRVMYIDLDVHHGDGVEEAFSASSRVMTVSVHKHSPGFFPGSGGLHSVGVGKGRGYSVNIPLLDGTRDEEFVPLVCRVLHKAHEKFSPLAVVCQCGADGLSGDPMDSFNLTPKALGHCLQFVLQWKLPTLVLGGGGYHSPNTARCWTHLTAILCGRKIPPEIPDHKFFMRYGPDYELPITPGNRKNMNSRESLQRIHNTIIENLNKLKTSPS
uniref:Histone deacetylase n=1 Tax=Crassostrea virginica TaxID=6565 RepID=A0A8B8AEM8_CRAVI|nr:histone deacetylase 8-like [Crassostrea virginica]